VEEIIPISQVGNLLLIGSALCPTDERETAISIDDKVTAVGNCQHSKCEHVQKFAIYS